MIEDKSAAMILLKDSLSEAQISVRAYDTKAQILGVGYIFALNVIGQVGEQLTQHNDVGIVTIIVAWAVVISPIALFGYVLYPVRKTSAERHDGNGANHILYLHPDRYNSASELITAAEECQPTDEIAHELINVSKLRESKRKRFVRGLIAAGFAFLLLFANQIFMSLA